MKHTALSLVLAAATAYAEAPQYIDIPPGCPQAVIDDSAEAAGDGLLVVQTPVAHAAGKSATATGDAPAFI